jgi:DNA-binding PucR family transcriptional regulator
MPDLSRTTPRDDVQALKAEIVRLNKVVDALMDRAEAGTKVQGSDFGLFQTTIMLQDQVRLHTEELEEALRRQEDEAPAAAAGDMQTLRRTAALQIQLLELVVQQKDVAELVERVASILDVPIVLFDPQGHVVCASRDAGAPDLAKRLWTAYRERDPEAGVATVTSTGERVSFRDVLVMGRVERVLAAKAGRHRPSEFAAASLVFLQQLVTLDLLRGKDELRMRRRLRRGLLQDVLNGDGTPDELRVRLQAQGFADDAVLRLAVVEPPDPAAGTAAAGGTAARRDADLLHALDAALSARRIPYLTASVDHRAAVLTAVPDGGLSAAHGLLAELRAAADQVGDGGGVAGCSAPLAGITGAARGLQQAKAACVAARLAPRPEEAGVFEELSGHFRLLDALDEDDLAALVERTFGPILTYDEQHNASLFKTLRTYFERRLAVQETADALHIHRNTLQKRLAHVEQLLGIDLGDLDAVVDLRLGLHAAELLGAPLD